MSIRRLFDLGVVLGLGFGLAVIVLGGTLHVRAGVAGNAQNGDVNDDGDLDLSDPVYLVLHLFKGGPAPVPCADRPELVARLAELEAELAVKSAALEACSAELLSLQAALAAKDATLTTCQEKLAQCQADLAKCGTYPGLPDTGQTKCYDAAGAVINCTSDTCPGQDGAYATGCPSEGRLTDNGDGTVTDNCTGLMWQKDTANAGNPLHWCEALTYCKNLILAGHDDWRLPNVRELQSIVDYGRFDPTIDPVFRATSSVYFSSTSHEGNPSIGVHINFAGGGCNLQGKGSSEFNFARAVRNAP